MIKLGFGINNLESISRFLLSCVAQT